MLLLFRPDAASPDAAPTESFPYPAEYAYKPEEATVASPSPAQPEVVQQEITENFPYPAQYAYHAEDGSHTHAADGSVVEEEEEVAAPLTAGVSPPAEAAPADAAPAPVEAAAPAVTSATFTLEGEKTAAPTLQGTESGWMWLPAWVGGVWDSVEAALFPVHPVMWEVLDVYAQAWEHAKHWLYSLIPTPLTPAQGERATEDSGAATQRGTGGEERRVAAALPAPDDRRICHTLTPFSPPLPSVFCVQRRRRLAR